MEKEHEIVSAYEENTDAWTKVVQEELSAVRKNVTGPAILETIIRFGPKDVLDLGCGEGWLVRALVGKGISASGVDASRGLIEKARNAGQGAYYVLSYSDLQDVGGLASFDVVSCNFSLLGDQSVDECLSACRAKLLTDSGTLIVQTLHPCFFEENEKYMNHWSEGTWAGLPGQFGRPAPWFFRTLSGWARLFNNHGFVIHDIGEPTSGKRSEAELNNFYLQTDEPELDKTIEP